jgi:hypothetical protein
VSCDELAGTIQSDGKFVLHAKEVGGPRTATINGSATNAILEGVCLPVRGGAENMVSHSTNAPVQSISIFTGFIP